MKKSILLFLLSFFLFCVQIFVSAFGNVNTLFALTPATDTQSSDTIGQETSSGGQNSSGTQTQNEVLEGVEVGKQIRVGHIVQIRNCINTAREKMNLPAYTYTGSATELTKKPIRSVHITEMRKAVSDLYTSETLQFTDPVITPKVTQVRAIHFIEIWNACQARITETPPSVTCTGTRPTGTGIIVSLLAPTTSLPWSYSVSGSARTWRCDTGYIQSGNTCVPTGGSSGPTVTLTSDKTTLSDPIEDVTLQWTVTNATRCTATGSWSGSKSITGGTQIVRPGRGEKVYTIDCFNAANVRASSSVTIIACSTEAELDTLYEACIPKLPYRWYSCHSVACYQPWELACNADASCRMTPDNIGLPVLETPGTKGMRYRRDLCRPFSELLNPDGTANPYRELDGFRPRCIGFPERNP